VPAIVDKDEFEVVQMLLKSRSPAMVAPRIVSGPTLHLLLRWLRWSDDAAHRQERPLPLLHLLH